MPVRPIDRPRRPWNKGLLIGQKKPLEPKHVWSIRVRLDVICGISARIMYAHARERFA
jgi:hypothetical protein